MKIIQGRQLSPPLPPAREVAPAACPSGRFRCSPPQGRELIGHLARDGKGEERPILEVAHKDVEEDEDHHLHHTRGWTRELWIAALGLPAVLPPPEEVEDVETAIGAARAEQSRNEMLKHRRASTKH